MAEEIQISELELKEDLAGDLVFPVESSTDTNSTTLSALKDWLKTYFVGMTEEETITGKKTFSKEAVFNGVSDESDSLGQIRIISAEDKYGAILRFDGSQLYLLLTNEGDPNGNWNDLRPLTINPTNGALTTITPANSTDNTTIPTTAWVKNILKTSGVGLATISKAGNGYCKFTNGLIIQWGRVTDLTASADGGTVTLPTAFTSTNYRLAITNEYSSRTVNASNSISSATTRSTTKFSFFSSYANAIDWLAIGY